jgi:acetyl-CoA C-acetyltransferase
MTDAVVVAAARSPIGRAFKGSLTGMRADEMAGQMVRAVLDQAAGLPVSAIADLYAGVAHQVGEQGQNLARRVAVLIGHDTLPGTTVSRACASSLQTTAMAFSAIKAGFGGAYLSVGVESVSRYTKLAEPAERHPALTRHDAVKSRGQEWVDPRQCGRLPDFYLDMGLTAENVARLCDVSREEQDAFALESQAKYAAADSAGFWRDEITPLAVPDGTVIDRDDSPRPATTVDTLAALPPAFDPDGSVTAGNACPLNDGAAALLVVSDSMAADHGLAPLARIVGFGLSALSPEVMGLGPVEACRRALALAGMSISDIDVLEINEAFAAQAVPCLRELGVDRDKVNPRGGAIALGHPFGMTGARMTTTLIHQLTQADQNVGLLTMCVGGGMGMAMIVERLS